MPEQPARGGQRVLKALAPGDATLKDIAARLGVNQQRVGHMIKRLPQADQDLIRRQLAAGRAARDGITAWRETKLVAHWARDHRCAVSEDAIAYRLKAGWPAEHAISLPPGAPRPTS